MLKSACICLESLTFSLAANANVLTFTLTASEFSLLGSWSMF